MRKLSEKQWALIEPLLPKQDYTRGGRPRADDKKMVEGIIWILTTGAQWNEVPVKYGSGRTCWRRFTQWKRQGVWKKIWQQLLVMLDKQDTLTWDIAYLDGTFASAKKGVCKSRQNEERERDKDDAGGRWNRNTAGTRNGSCQCF